MPESNKDRAGVFCPYIVSICPFGSPSKACFLTFLNSMPSLRHLFRCCCCLAVLACMVAAWPARAAPPLQPPALKLRVVGGLASIGQFTRLEEPFWSQELPRLSQGRFSADIVAFDRAAIPGTQMLQLLQLGVVPFGTMLMSHVAEQYPQYAAADLAGLNPDIAQLRTSLAAFRPYLEQSLRQEYGIELLAVYIYPAQVFFCQKPLTGLADLAGRRIRVSSSSQADFVSALGAVPVRTAFASIPEALGTGALDCAITGAASGNTLGLHRVTSHLYPLSLTWGMAIFGANSATWNALPPELQALLRRELPLLEARIWRDAERETVSGLDCNSGKSTQSMSSTCTGANLGRMVVVPVSAQDEHLREKIFRSAVLPRWLLRCGADCQGLWRSTIGAARAIALPAVP